MIEYPFRKIGFRIRKLRESAQETIADVSAAVEIDSKTLANIELGKERPSEDILVLLLNHFSVKDNVANKIWEVAGYLDTNLESEPVDSNLSDQQRVAMVLPMDVRIVYTDMVHVMVNNYGVVMNFMQGSGPNMQPLAVSRIGMSKEHALSVMKVLQETLAKHYTENTPKFLPEPPRN